MTPGCVADRIQDAQGRDRVAGAHDVALRLACRDSLGDVERLVRQRAELKAFESITLRRGEAGLVRFKLPQDAFAFWDEARSTWTIEDGEFEVRAGASSRDIRSSARITVRGGVKTAEILSPRSPVRRFLKPEGARDVLMPAAELIPIFGDVSALDPFTRKIVDEVIKGMPLQRLVAASNGQFTGQAMYDLLASVAPTRK